MAAAAELAALVASARRRASYLESELRDLEAATADGPDDEHDPEGATIGYERARVIALLGRARADVTALQAAARRAATGTYGTCVACGRSIPAERLEALPATDRCVACADGSPPGAAPRCL
ncbi:MAG: TraR/DksA C4-type zinc finger protein [Actinomycetota bacterium]|nr:TraR/DksA C4-type zinc finger protein [Actinomycetota bacterium]